MGVTAYGVLSRGLISGHWNKNAAPAANDFRNFSPRFQGENLQANLARADRLRACAAELGLTPAQAAIAWGAAQGPDVIALVGARRRDRLAEALGALARPLSANELALLEAAVPRGSAVGGRYATAQMAMLDSERK